ncbi:hypothetical protein KZ810_16155 [Sphingomonas sp. RHCKR47]|nr:hypothetical protein [Sphingomonas citricola]
MLMIRAALALDNTVAGAMMRRAELRHSSPKPELFRRATAIQSMSDCRVTLLIAAAHETSAFPSLCGRRTFAATHEG